jgi:beta-mannosidase
MTVTAEEDTSRPIWPSCPSTGWKTGVDMLWGLPNGSPLGLVANSFEPADVSFSRAAAQIPAAATLPNADACTFLTNIDFDQGSSGPNFKVANASACCELCQANSATCYVATFSLSYSTCWFKNVTQSQLPVYNSGGVIGVVPAGHTVGPIPPPTPPTYKLETHGPYQHGEGFTTVNSHSSLDLFNPNIPPTLGPSVPTGPSWWGTYASEFGCSCMSSFESMSPTLAPGAWGLHAPPMSERNYAADNELVVYFENTTVRTAIGEQPFKAQLYQAVLGQALEMKGDITHRRSINSFGTVIWQLGEV